MKSLIFFLIIFGVCSVEAAKILVIPAYHYSHVNLMGVAGSALDSSGHDVTLMVSNTFAKTPEKFKLKPIIYEVSKDAVMKDRISELIDINVSLGMVYRVITEIYPLFGKVCDQVLGNKILMDMIAAEKFDLILMDGVAVISCFYVIPYKLGIPYVTLNVLLDPWSLGLSTSAAIEPSQAIPMNNQLNFFDQLKLSTFYMVLYYLPPMTISSDKFVGKYAPEKPLVTAHTLYKKSEMFLVNNEITCVDYPRLSAPHYQFIGGSSAHQPKPLPDDLQDFVGSASDGIVVISFGSLPAWQKMWKNLKTKIIYVFSNIPQKAVALYSLDEDIKDFPPNIKAMKWLPQNDLLGHPNTKLFVTHGGNNGQLESVYHGVPSLVVPFGGDQIYNGIRAEAHGYGKLVRYWDTVTKEELLEIFKELLKNETYSENVKKCSRIIKSQPSTQERIVFWVNHVLEFGGSHLHPPGLDMPLYKLLMVDIILFATVVVIINLILGILCCRCVIRKCCLSRGSKEKEA